jgi:hypothetical protein
MTHIVNNTIDENSVRGIETNFEAFSTNRHRVSDHLWSFLMGLLVGTSTGVFSGVILVMIFSHWFGR